MSTIRPRYTPYQNGVRLSEALTGYQSSDYARPIAYCAICGARLSRYRYPGETRCAPCITRHTSTLTAEALHPPVYHRDMASTCPNCGGPKYRTAELCRGCDKIRRAGR